MAVERKIDEASDGVVRERVEEESARNILNTRTKQAESLQKQGEDNQNRVKELTATIKNLSAKHRDLESRFEEANAKAEKLNIALNSTRDSLSQDAETQESLDSEIRTKESELANPIT